MTAPLMQIGASREAIEAARDAILAIVTAGHSGKTTRKALAVFARICRVDHVTVSGSTFTGAPYPVELEKPA